MKKELMASIYEGQDSCKRKKGQEKGSTNTHGENQMRRKKEGLHKVEGEEVNTNN